MEPGFYAEHFRSETWDWWHVGRRRVLRRVLGRVLADLGLDDGADMLDLGCGTGGTTTFLAESRTMTGLDASRDALRFSRQRGLTQLVQASAESLPFPDGSFDAVLALDVLEHHEDDASVAREVRRVLRPGGVLLATVPAFRILWGPHDVLSRHYRRYRLGQLGEVLAKEGLTLRVATYFNALLFPGVLAVQVVRRFLRRGAEPKAASDLPKNMPGFVNALLRETFAFERFVLPTVSLPFGVSALAVAMRPREDAA